MEVAGRRGRTEEGGQDGLTSLQERLAENVITAVVTTLVGNQGQQLQQPFHRRRSTSRRWVFGRRRHPGNGGRCRRWSSRGGGPGPGGQAFAQKLPDVKGLRCALLRLVLPPVHRLFCGTLIEADQNRAAKESGVCVGGGGVGGGSEAAQMIRVRPMGAKCMSVGRLRAAGGMIGRSDSYPQVKR